MVRDRRARGWLIAVTGLLVLIAVGVVILVLFQTGVLKSAQSGAPESVALSQTGSSEGEEGTRGEGQGASSGDDQGEDQGDDQGNQAASRVVFTAEQADRGAESYASNCASCHGQELAGGPDGVPALTGDEFLASWQGMPVSALYGVISETMPLDAPGSLDRQTYEDVTAHILAVNGMQAGDTELDANESQTMWAEVGGEEAEADASGEAADTETAEGGEEGGEEGRDTEAAQSTDSETADAETTDSETAEGADGEETSGENDETTAEESDETAGDDGETAAAEESDTAAEENGETAEGEDGEEIEETASDNGETPAGEADAGGLQLEQLGEDEQPPADEGWLALTVEPSAATINILGPEGYLGQVSGEGTITGLEPGTYVVAASQGNFSHRMDAEVLRGETTQLQLRVPRLADSADLADAGSDEGESGAGGGEGGAQQPEGAQREGQEGEQDSEGGQDGENQQDSEGWFTEEQAERGAEEYSANCASCHGEDGMGEPPLADGAIEQSFETVWALYDFTSTQMPDDAPGSLDEETYVDITAHLLAMNDYPAGDEELAANDSAMSDMALGSGSDGDASAPNGSDGGEPAPDESEDGGQAADSEQAADGEEQADGADRQQDQEQARAGAEQATETTAASRGASLFSANCAVCHGETLEGVSAPPLAGPVFMERWGGHPVEWLYYQARVAMPPDSPGSLADEDYVDLMVFVLAENGVLAGDEVFEPLAPRLRATVIGGPEEQGAPLELRIQQLRDELHEPFQGADPEAGAEPNGAADPEPGDDPEVGDDGEGEAAGEEQGTPNGEGEDVGSQDDEGSQVEDGPEGGAGDGEDAEDGE